MALPFSIMMWSCSVCCCHIPTEIDDSGHTGLISITYEGNSYFNTLQHIVVPVLIIKSVVYQITLDFRLLRWEPWGFATTETTAAAATATARGDRPTTGTHLSRLSYSSIIEILHILSFFSHLLQR